MLNKKFRTHFKMLLTAMKLKERLPKEVRSLYLLSGVYAMFSIPGT